MRLFAVLGLYEGTTNYIGTEKLGAAVAKQQSDNAVALSLTALKVRSKTRGGKPDDYVDQVLGERRRIAGAYERWDWIAMSLKRSRSIHLQPSTGE
jgi:hypothetical protein